LFVIDWEVIIFDQVVDEVLEDFGAGNCFVDYGDKHCRFVGGENEATGVAQVVQP
jgi:hypothetical protein